MRGTISNGHTQVNVPYLQDFSLKRHNWAQRIWASDDGLKPIERRPRPDQIEMEIAAQEDAGRGGDAEAGPASLGPGEALNQSPEQRELVKIERMRRVIGTGEMAHRMHDGNAVEQRRIGGQPRP